MGGNGRTRYHDEKSAARIEKASPGSHQAIAARKAAKRHAANGEGSKGSKKADQPEHCQNQNSSGRLCSQAEPCDYHFYN
ncbi:hypothetical protein BGZ60DRAFT_530325 [Tricladium varicosporioides]|nr:hypothetical protein BGZ60DRAFT_530325 [Hymenoscyphus varicosporioides]